MYRILIRPILFLFPPERIHKLLAGSVVLLFRIPGIAAFTRFLFRLNDPLLETDFLGIKFNNPVGMAAGFDKNGAYYNQFSDFGFSHIEVGTVTPEGQFGNPKPRSFRIPADRGLINRMGFNNQGVEALTIRLAKKRRKGLVLGGNIGKNTLTPNSDAIVDYETCFRALSGFVDYYVVNVSCPNITDLHELQDQDKLESILQRLTEIRRQMKIQTPVLLKISPDLNHKQIDTTLEIVEKYGIDGIVATNTTITRANLSTEPEVIRTIGNGGMSGAPLTIRSLEVVRYISEKTGGNLPIIGVGGIMSVQDALNMLDAGATLLQVYTGFIYNGPGFIRKINRAILKNRLKKQN